MRNLPAITGLRGIAAFAVVLFHVVLIASFSPMGFPDHVVARVMNFGWIGVDLFFVLTGFLLSMPILASPERLREPGYYRTYLAKRFLRIAPAYYLSILLIFTLFNVWATLRPGDVLLHLFYLHNYTEGTFLSISGVYWTLALEAQFYLVLPFAALLFLKRRWAWTLAASAIITLAYRAVTFDATDDHRSFWLTAQLPAFMFHFAIGMTAARFYVARPQLSTQARYAIGLGSISLLIATLAWWVPSDGMGAIWESTYVLHTIVRPLLALAGAGIVFSAVTASEGVVTKALASRPFQWLGDVSYSLYLVHLTVMYAIWVYAPQFVQPGRFVDLALLSVFGSLATAGIFHAIAEKPFLKVKVRLTTPKPTTVATQTSVTTIPSLVPSPVRIDDGSGPDLS